MATVPPTPAGAPEPPPPRRGIPVWFKLCVPVLLFLGIVSAYGSGFKPMLAWAALVLFIDLIGGGLLCFLIFLRILLPLTITIVLTPFSLIWPGDSQLSHWTTVRSRFRS